MVRKFVETALDSPTGARLKIYSRMPDRRVRAVVQVNHGMAEHGARYARFAEALSEAGFGTYAHDHRGHGGTTAPGAPLGAFGQGRGFDKVIADVLAVNGQICDRDADTPVVCFGHSMGSIIALNFALRHPDRVVGLACWNGGVETGALAHVARILLRLERRFRGRDAASKIARKLTFSAWNNEFKPVRTDFDWLSRDAAEVDKYVADPLCGFDVSIGLWLDVLDGVFYGGNDRHLTGLARDLPIHLLGGADDPGSERGKHMTRLATRLDKAGLMDVTCNILPETRHESLNDVNREATTRDFIDWLEKRFP